MMCSLSRSEPMFDEALKAGRTAPADLLGRAATIARALNGDGGGRGEK